VTAVELEDGEEVGALRRRLEALPAWAEAVLIGVASRVFAATFLVIAWKFTIFANVGRGGSWQSPFLLWDAEWYLWIVKQGYHAQAVAHTAFGPGYHDFAFWPLWPAVILLTSLGGKLEPDIVAPIVANLLFVLACIPIHRVLERFGGRNVARFGLLLFAFSPMAYVYSLVYSEPLFLLLAGIYFATTKPVLQILIAPFVQLSRLSGFAIAVAALADLRDRKTRVRGVGTILGVLAAFGGWWTWIALLTHNPMGYMLGTPSWYSMDALHGSPRGIESILHANHWSVVATIVFIPILAVGIVVLFRRREYRLGLFSLTLFASSFLASWNTMPRLAAIAFPVFGALAAILPHDRARWVAVMWFAATEAILAMLSVAGYVIP
jgi:hypothetical protein